MLRRRRERVLTLLAIFLILAASAAAAFFLLKLPPVVPRAIIAAAEQAVRNAVGPGFACAFSRPPETTLERVDGNRFVVRGQVAAVDPSGRSRGFHFECSIIRLGDETWGPEQLTLQPW